jgi:hypothetical protein
LKLDNDDEVNMRVIVLFAAFLLSLNWISCNDNPQDNNSLPPGQGTYKITGYVTFEGEPLPGANVMIVNSTAWKAKSGPDGKFNLEGLTRGDHLFRIEKIFDNSSLAAQEFSLVLIKDITDMGEIKLPRPFSLYPLSVSGEDESKVTITWNKSTEADFLGYKIFRKDQPDVNDKNGELVYSSSNRNDTIYTEINVRTGLTHYYRIYTYLSGLKSCGSNFQSVNIPEFNIVVNPGFENSQDGVFPDLWFERLSGEPDFRYFSVTKDFVHSGNKSLKIYYNEDQANPYSGRDPWGGLMQTISKIYLTAGRQYTLSFWAKSETGSFQVRLVKNNNLEDHLVSYIVPAKTEWSEQKLIFTADQSNYYELWISVRPGFAENGTIKGYIDDLKILK